MHDLLIIFKSLSGCQLIKITFKINKLCLLKKVIDGRAPEYLTASSDTLHFEHNYYPTRAKTSYHLPKPRTKAMRRTFFYSTIKDLNALNLNPTASFDSMKTTLIINNIAPIYMVDNFKLKKLFLIFKFLISLYIDSTFYLSIGFLS